MKPDKPQDIKLQGLVCPIPHQHTQTVIIGHGSGGLLTRDLIQNIFHTRIGNDYLAQCNDAARLILEGMNNHMAVSTDTHVVSPLFFPGGDIGRLSVSGTVNDVAMLGATPKFITAGFILEEGFPIHSLEKILDSMATTCQEAGVKIAAGDTKVVEKGKADGLFINTAGFGPIKQNITIGGQFAQPGDVLLVSGTIGDHAIAVLQARGDLGFDSNIQSDVAPLNHMIADLIEAVPEVHVLRDPTRGGLATSLKEIACQSQVSIRLFEEAIPINPDVQMACEMLGFDPLYLANEGKVIAILPEEKADQAIKCFQQSPYGTQAAKIGLISSDHPGEVLLQTVYGTTRMLEMLTGEILPRIC